MSELIDPVVLTQKLVRMNTVNPGATEEKCAAYLADLLEHEGFDVYCSAFAPGRTSLIATSRGGGSIHNAGYAEYFKGHLGNLPLRQIRKAGLSL